MIRWLAAFIGFLLFRWVGAIFGYLLGSLLDNTYGGSARGYTEMFRGQDRTRVSPADFELNLLSLASLVIKADGQVNQAELDFVRTYFVQAYGKERANATFKVFNEVVKKREISASRVAGLLRQRMRYEARLQVLHFLFSIANADGVVSQAEASEIQRISGYLGVQSPDFESIKAMFFKNPDSAYRILEIEPGADPAEIKSAYRRMAKKYHPDKLQHMDEAYRKGAEEKFRKVQEAYEQLQKEKGF
jgi:DnaJ like chaperone protein